MHYEKIFTSLLVLYHMTRILNCCTPIVITEPNCGLRGSCRGEKILNFGDIGMSREDYNELTFISASDHEVVVAEFVLD